MESPSSQWDQLLHSREKCLRTLGRTLFWTSHCTSTGSGNGSKDFILVCHGSQGAVVHRTLWPCRGVASPRTSQTHCQTAHAERCCRQNDILQGSSRPVHSCHTCSGWTCYRAGQWVQAPLQDVGPSGHRDGVCFSLFGHTSDLLGVILWDSGSASPVASLDNGSNTDPAVGLWTFYGPVHLSRSNHLSPGIYSMLSRLCNGTFRHPISRSQTICSATVQVPHLAITVDVDPSQMTNHSREVNLKFDWLVAILWFRKKKKKTLRSPRFKVTMEQKGSVCQYMGAANPSLFVLLPHSYSLLYHDMSSRKYSSCLQLGPATCRS